ncbi:MAG: Rrf2 family transcriptional regulator [Eubacterium sp.]|nr:Rrf2 family transcriptional regulator [Eubacterium sp.]
MKLTTRGRYGLRAMIDLAVHEQESAVSAQSIAERQDLSERYLEQLIRAMKKAGLVESIRGAGGGYRLARPADQISVGDILRALEGSIDAVSCPAITIEGMKDTTAQEGHSSSGEGDTAITKELIEKFDLDQFALAGSGCEGADWCVTKYVWKRINDAIAQAVDSIMLDQLVEESRMLLAGKGDVKPSSLC